MTELSHLRVRYRTPTQGNLYQNREYTGDPERLVDRGENEWLQTEQIGKLKIVRFFGLIILEIFGFS